MTTNRKGNAQFGVSPESRGTYNEEQERKFIENIKSGKFGKMAGKKVAQRGGKTTYRYE